MSNSRSPGIVEFARTALARMRYGPPAYGPLNSDRIMFEHKLLPEDIGSSDDEIEAAKRQWRIGLARVALREMEKGNSAYDPAYFDSTMAAYALTPEDLGSTAEQIESAKARWAEKQVR